MNTARRVAEKLYYLRNERNVSQEELAKILGCSQRAISYWESGKREIPLEKLEEICKYFSVDANFFFFSADDSIEARLSRLEQAVSAAGVNIENNNGHVVNNANGKVKIGNTVVKK